MTGLWITHTPGQLKRDGQELYEIDEFGKSWPIANVNDRNHGLEESDNNARLLFAAWNSYDTHCGSRAVECAENDLLGKLLEVCKRLAFATYGDDEGDDQVANLLATSSTMSNLYAALAEAGITEDD